MKIVIDIPEAVCDWIKQEWVDNPECNGILDEIMRSILNCKPYEEKPQGKWIEGGKDVTGQYFYDEFICNKCFVVVTDKSNFCPKCGADMRKGNA